MGIDPLPYDMEVPHHSSPLCFDFHLYFLLSFFQQNFGNHYCFSANLAFNLSRDREPETKEKGLTRGGGGGGSDIGGILAVAIWEVF